MLLSNNARKCLAIFPLQFCGVDNAQHFHLNSQRTKLKVRAAGPDNWQVVRHPAQYFCRLSSQEKWCDAAVALLFVLCSPFYTWPDFLPIYATRQEQENQFNFYKRARPEKVPQPARTGKGWIRAWPDQMAESVASGDNNWLCLLFVASLDSVQLSRARSDPWISNCFFILPRLMMGWVCLTN